MKKQVSCGEAEFFWEAGWEGNNLNKPIDQA